MTTCCRRYYKFQDQLIEAFEEMDDGVESAEDAGSDQRKLQHISRLLSKITFFINFVITFSYPFSVSRKACFYTALSGLDDRFINRVHSSSKLMGAYGIIVATLLRLVSLESFIVM